MGADDIPGISPEIQFPPLDELQQPGVYFLLSRGEIVYVGQSVDMRRRIGQHFSDYSKRFDAVRFFPCKPEQLIAWEKRCIRAFRPPLNNCTYSAFLRNTNAPIEDLVLPRKRKRKKKAALAA